MSLIPAAEDRGIDTEWLRIISQSVLIAFSDRHCMVRLLADGVVGGQDDGSAPTTWVGGNGRPVGDDTWSGGDLTTDQRRTVFDQHLLMWILYACQTPDA